MLTCVHKRVRLNVDFIKTLVSDGQLAELGVTSAPLASDRQTIVYYRHKTEPGVRYYAMAWTTPELIQELVQLKP